MDLDISAQVSVVVKWNISVLSIKQHIVDFFENGHSLLRCLFSANWNMPVLEGLVGSLSLSFYPGLAVRTKGYSGMPHFRLLRLKILFVSKTYQADDTEENGL